MSGQLIGPIGVLPVMGVLFQADGSNTSAGLGPQTVSLTTANGSGLIVVGVLAQTAGLPISVSGLGLTWTATNPGGFTLTDADIAFFYTAPYASNVSGNISVGGSVGVYQTAHALAISGAKTISFLDGTVQTSSAASPAITTTNANDCIVALVATDGTTSGAGAGWTGCVNAAGANYSYMEYQFPGVTGTYTGTMGTGTIVGGIIMAVQKGP